MVQNSYVKNLGQIICVKKFGSTNSWPKLRVKNRIEYIRINKFWLKIFTGNWVTTTHGSDKFHTFRKLLGDKSTLVRFCPVVTFPTWGQLNNGPFLSSCRISDEKNLKRWKFEWKLTKISGVFSTKKTEKRPRSFGLFGSVFGRSGPGKNGSVRAVFKDRTEDRPITRGSSHKKRLDFL